MRADLIELVDDAAFGVLGDEDVEVGDPAVTARAIYDPEEADVPGGELARRSDRVLRLVFRQSAGLDLSRGTRVVFREMAYTVDGSPDVADDLIYVSLLPETT